MTKPRMNDRPVRVSDLRPTFFAQVPLQLLDDSALDSAAIAVYTALDSFRNLRSGLCIPGYETLAKRAKVGRSKLAESLSILRDAGWLSWETVRTRTGIVNSYVLLWREDRPPSGLSSDGVVRQADGGRPAGGLGVVRPADSNETEKNENKGTRDDSSSRLGPRPGNGVQKTEAQTAGDPKKESHGLRLVKAWIESFDHHFGKKPVILWGRDVRLMNKVVESYGAETAEKMLHAFWKFRIKTGKPVTIPTFYSVADRVFFEVKEGRKS